MPPIIWSRAARRLLDSQRANAWNSLIDQGGTMNTYVILRRGGWRSPEELQAAAARSTEVGNEEMSDDIRWIRSYVMAESDGGLGTVCIYQATSPEKIREHAERADLPVTEIIEVAETVIVRPDPEPAAV